jgi:hypothetical protein
MTGERWDLVPMAAAIGATNEGAAVGPRMESPASRDDPDSLHRRLTPILQANASPRLLPAFSQVARQAEARSFSASVEFYRADLPAPPGDESQASICAR